MNIYNIGDGGGGDKKTVEAITDVDLIANVKVYNNINTIVWQCMNINITSIPLSTLTSILLPSLLPSILSSLTLSSSSSLLNYYNHHRQFHLQHHYYH